MNIEVQFQFALLTDTMYSPLPPDLLPPGLIPSLSLLSSFFRGRSLSSFLWFNSQNSRCCYCTRYEEWSEPLLEFRQIETEIG